jgi:type III restriction enzyme
LKMTVQIKFESGQDFQLEAIEAVCSLFEGWTQELSHSYFPGNYIDDSATLFSEAICSNTWGITDDELLSNARRVQDKSRFNELGEKVAIVPEAQRLGGDPGEPLRDFSVEMETGTGKTYVYLRTALELNRKYGLSKFVVVVPTVAIREGVVASLSMMKQHFSDIYPGVQYDSYVYDSNNVTRLRQFATSQQVQILVMNIQAFNGDGRIIMRPADNLNGMRPVDFITAVNPIVIMDEPQKLDGLGQKGAIEGLNPLFRLRYSATHKNTHCLVYRLGPVDAYERRLVKRIEVLSMTAEEDENIAYVELKRVNVGNGSPTATVVLNSQTGRVQKTLRMGDSLSELTGKKIYAGWDVEQIAAPTGSSSGYLEFRNGRRVSVTQNTEVDQDWWQRAQIQAAIQKHFETELRLKFAAENGEITSLKPLTLFFIDRVSNYEPEDGKFKVWFDELYDEVLSSNRRFRNLNLPPAPASRAGYFSRTKGLAKDTNGDSVDDIQAYDLIMRNKERLLSPEEPVRFIFSHTALSEGWDNPNVFTICNLQETKSEVKRRQQIGRGLRLPVMTNGERSRNHQYNVLTVIASESFEKYADELQREIQSETGETFAGKIQSARNRKSVNLKEDFKDLPGFRDLWEKISAKTSYKLTFEAQDLIDEASERLRRLGKAEPLTVPKIIVQTGEVKLSLGRDIEITSRSSERRLNFERKIKKTDLIGELQAQLPISRSSIVKIIEASSRMSEANKNPAQFSDQVRRSVQQALAHTIVDQRGIKYERERGNDSFYSADIFEGRLVEAYADSIVRVDKSIYDSVVIDSEVERQYALDLDKREDVELFLKLPNWFKIDTPIGGYNPDWAIVRKLKTGEKIVYLVRETKGTTDISALRFEGEAWKIEFGRKHFLAIDVDYKVASKANQLDVDIPFKLHDEEPEDRVSQ